MDVMTKIRSSQPIHNGYSVCGVQNTYSNGGSGIFVAQQHGTNEAVPMSGVNGQTNDGYLDQRFDDRQYYTA